MGIQSLKSRAVDDLQVNGQLTATVTKNEDADGATARLESLDEAAVERGLVKDGKGLLDIASLSHSSDGTIADIEDAVLLEDGSKHSLHDNRRRGVGDCGRFLVQLAREEVDAKVAVLAGSGGCGDLDNLAWTTLEDQNIADADVMGWDTDGLDRALVAIAEVNWGHDVFGGLSKVFGSVGEFISNFVGCVA